MKTDLASSIGVAILGAVIAFFLCNLLIIDPMKEANKDGTAVKVLDSTVGTDLQDPDPEVFNYKALNPTVEVYVGDCKEYINGECLDDKTNVIEEGVLEETPAGSDSDSNDNKTQRNE